MALKRIFKTVKKVAGAPGRAVAGAYFDAKTRASEKRAAGLVDDIKTVREMRASGVESGSLQDPQSRIRREMRINDFKAEMEEQAKPKKRLFRRN